MASSTTNSIPARISTISTMGSSLYGAICGGGKGPRRRGSPRNLIRSAEKIVLLRSQSPEEEDSDNRTPGALACLVLCLGLIYRAHAGLYENEMPPVYRYPCCNRPRPTTTGICHCLDPTRVNRDDTTVPPSSRRFSTDEREEERNRFSIFAQPETTFFSFHSSAILDVQGKF